MGKLSLKKSEYSSFRIITADHFKELGINPAYIPVGSVVSQSNPYDILKKIHPNLDFLLKNKFGRDPWGGGTEFGLAEGISEQEFNIFIHIDDPSISPEEKNEVLRKLLLKTVSQDNKIYYIIPGYLAADFDNHTRQIKSILQSVINKYYLQSYRMVCVLEEKQSFLVGTTAGAESLLSQSICHLFPQINFKHISLERQYPHEEKFNLIYIPDFISILLNLLREAQKDHELDENSIFEYIKFICKDIYRKLKPSGIMILYFDLCMLKRYENSKIY
ncbi:MAG: hypothetical protein HY934_09440 [Candidatus Firestonebacteria bacterium]|nr:hypothetical protein [Candidatus Firestonebacteria bacterium]